MQFAENPTFKTRAFKVTRDSEIVPATLVGRKAERATRENWIFDGWRRRGGIDGTTELWSRSSLFGFVIFRRRSLTQSRRDTRRDKIKKKKEETGVPRARIDTLREQREKEREKERMSQPWITLPIYLRPVLPYVPIFVFFSFPFSFLSLLLFFSFIPHLYFTSRSSSLCAT